MRPCLFHEPQIKGQIVKRGNLFSQKLVTHKKVSKVGLLILGIHIRQRFIVYRREVVFPLLILNVYCSMRSE